MELEFKRDTSFRKQFFTAESFAHPAKMDAQLLLWIVERYTKPRQVILDPMAGMGTTMLACTLGRDVILVELEEKFCNMCKSNWEKVSAMPQLGYEMGQCNIVQGDARQLEGLLVDKCIFSPPYVSGGHHNGVFKTWGGGHAERVVGQAAGESKEHGYGDNPSNIGNLPYGNIDSIITSPPYEGIEARDRSKEASFEREKSGQYARHGDLNISKGYSVDSIITSPPYEEAHSSKNLGVGDGDRADLRAYSWLKEDNPQNIGNLKSDSYLEAMLQVYQQCHKVLKPQGLMILVTKNFIREKQIVRLDEDTIKLCEQAGFSFLERHYRKLSSQSFWRTIYHQKYPGVEKIEFEDVLVFTK